MARQFVPYTIDSFIGGITDKVVKPSNPVQYETLKNLIPQRDESLRQRDGFKLWDNTDEDLNILQMFEFQGFVFYYCSDKRFYYIANSGTGTPAIVPTISNTTTYVATSYDGTWHISECAGELILTHEPIVKSSSTRTAIRRIYIDENGVPVICTAQLPRVLPVTRTIRFSSSAFGLVDNTIDIGFEVIADGSIIKFTHEPGYPLAEPLVADTNYYVKMFLFNEFGNQIIVATSLDNYNSSTFVDITTYGANALQDQYAIVFPTEPYVVPDVATPAYYSDDFLFYWQQSYNILVDGEVLEKIIYGEPSEVFTVTSADEETNLSFVVDWAEFDNNNLNNGSIVDDNFGDSELWDITQIELVVGSKRTVISTGVTDVDFQLWEYAIWDNHPNQSPLTLLTGDLPNDDDPDVPDPYALLSARDLYFSDGTLDQQSLINGAYFNTSVDSISYYGHTGAGSIRIYTAMEDAPYWTNLLSFVELPKPITGLDNYSSKAIAFSSDGSYRIEGQKYQDGSGSLYYRTISDSHGCIAGHSIVKTQYGLFFWSKSGIFICDGIKANRISDSLQARYKSWITSDAQKNAIRGWYDDEEDKVYWVVQESDGHTFLLVLDLYFGVSSESVFYVIDSDHSYWNITDGMLNSYDNKILIAGNEFIYQPDPSYTYDALSGYVSSAVVGLNVPIKYDYKSPVITYNDKLGRKWTSHIVLNMKDSDSAAGVSTRIRSYADLSANPHYLDPCFYYQEMYSDDQEWGNIDPVWGESQRPIFKRYFDQSTVRNTFIQIGFDNLKIVKYTDADYEKATYVQTMDGSDPVRYLILPTTLFTSSPITGNEALDGSWYIKLEEDDYETEYAVTSIEANATFLQINLPADTELTSGTLTQSNHGWKLCQISKEHRFHLLSYSLLYTPMGHRTIPGYQTEKMNGE